MDKYELYREIRQLPSVLGWQGHGAEVMVAKDSVLELVRHLDEPQKVVVPRFVAEHIEYLRGINSPMRDLYNIAWLDNDQLVQWLYNEPGADDLLGRAWLDGYVVEREKLYTVEIPDPNRKGKNRVYLTKDPATGKIFVTKGKFYPKTNKQTWLTESEIRKDFDWAWQWAEEVKEVE